PLAGIGLEQFGLFRPDGSGRTESPRISLRGQLAPGGARIVYMSAEDGDAEIFVADADGTDAKKLTDNGVIDNQPTWSPDGKQIAFASTRNGKWQIFVMDGNGAKIQQRTREPQGAWHPQFGPSGQFSYLTWRGQAGKSLLTDLVVADAKESKTIVENIQITDYAWSPNGKTIAYGKVGALAFHELATGKSREVSFPEIHRELYSHGAHRVSWRPDGQAVACSITFLGGRRAGTKSFGDEEVFVIPQGGKPTWFHPGGPYEHFDWFTTPDQDR
ncbi:MAG: hypothetical protein WD176_06650, partial [Pirellulales bacterium]